MSAPSSPPVSHSYIPAAARLREFSFFPIFMGTLLGLIFGASSLYLVLKVGLTVSASIPVAVISITLFKLLSRLGWREATILENNIVQTAGSAGESLAFGVGVTMPAILILGFDLELTRIALVSVLGGLLGVLMMIPLRRALIVAQHGKLKYPEGTACAEVLKAGASAESRAAASEAAQRESKALAAAGAEAGTNAFTIFAGFGIGLVYKVLNVLMKFWKDTPERVFGAPFKGASVSAEISPELLGVGYIIGPTIASVMCAGGVLSYLVLIPAIKFFGEKLSAPLAPGKTLIADMGPDDIRSAYILYIGAGAVAAGGIISVVRSLPLIWHGIREGLRDFRSGGGSGASRVRTEHDMSLKIVGVGIVALLAAIVFSPSLHMNLVGALLIVVFGFLFVTVSSRLTGEIGSSSNPVSGMTVATLLLTCLIFLILGWTGSNYYVTALSVGGIVCIAASNGGTTSQDLKTGFLVGATPRYQQIALLIGVLGSAFLMGPILKVLNDSGTVYVEVAKQPGFPATLRADPAQLQVKERIKGRQAAQDTKEYLVWFNVDEKAGPKGRYLVDETGRPVWLVDPGINGVYRNLPDGTEAKKFGAPKAVLVSYIIEGILKRELPWHLVLLGVMIAVVLEMSLVSSLAFAVGVYLPLSSSTPIWIGGLVRWLVDRHVRRKYAGKNLTEDQLVAEGDKSPGVLLSSGYIAGGAIAGIFIAFMAGLADPDRGRLGVALVHFQDWVDTLAKKNPFMTGGLADLWSLVPFAILVALLYAAGRDLILSGRRQGKGS